MAWLAGTVAGFIIVPIADPDPFTVRGALLPVAALGVLAVLLVPLSRRLRDGAGLVCGVFAAWIAMTLRAMLNGTPYGFAGLYGDMGRIAAAATRYSATPWSADAFVDGIPAEYPLLYPWLVGRLSALTGVPAWRLLGEAEIITVSGAVVAAFLLWRRLVKAPIALGITTAGLVAFGDPRKAFEVLAVLVFVPWVILTFGRPPRGRLTWWAAGIIGGLMVLTYQGFLIYGSLGLLVIAGTTWWRSGDRAAFGRHLLGVIALAAAIGSWYVIPYVAAVITRGGQAVADLYEPPVLVANPFPFFELTVFGVLAFAGLVGLFLYRASAWWAAPLLCLVVGAYVYRVLMTARFVIDGHTGFFHYTTRLVGPLLAAAGVLTVAHLLRSRKELAVPALAVLMVWSGLSYWRLALPENVEPWSRMWPSTQHFFTARAHEEKRTPFPAEQVRAGVEAVLGKGARPRTLSYDERLFAYLPWPGYISVDRTSANSLSRWDERRAELHRLSLVANPLSFAQAATATRFGSIDVFVLKDWHWRDIAFSPSQFDPVSFQIVENLPRRIVLLIRKQSEENPWPG